MEKNNGTGLDATGMPIILGNNYGYVLQHNGITNIVIGKIIKVKIEENKAYIEVISEKKACWYSDPEKQRVGKNRWVKTFIVFPVTSV